MTCTYLKNGFLLILLLGMECCIQPFSPPQIASASGYLVVDGFLNTGQGASQIQLRRTQNVSDSGNPSAELQAQVSVEGDKGSHYSFSEQGDGAYYLAEKPFNANEQYRLRIKTTDGKEYLSDYVPVKKTPRIDSLTWRVDEGKDGVQIFLNTHDPNNQTRFYRWKFEETWQSQSAFYSNLEVRDDSIQARTEDISTCWKTEKATHILLSNSIQLSQDIIQDFRLTFIPVSTHKLLYKYSILVKQYGLTQEAFDYWANLAKTTENSGTLFDPQPSQGTGNIHSLLEPRELVFGFFSATSLEEKRMFIKASLGRNPFCEESVKDTLSYAEALQTPNLILYSFCPPPPLCQTIKNFLYVTSPPSCADCRLGGGVNVKPDFWQ